MQPAANFCVAGVLKTPASLLVLTKLQASTCARKDSVQRQSPNRKPTVHGSAEINLGFRFVHGSYIGPGVVTNSPQIPLSF